MGYFDQFKNEGVPFMENATQGKIKEHLGEELHVDDFGIIQTKQYGKCAVVHFAEYPGKFFFGNEYLTDMLEQVRADGMQGLLAASTIVFFEKVAKESGNAYIAFDVMEFNPNA